MTDAELIQVVKKYWLTRGKPEGKAHWRRIEEEFGRRTRDDMQARFDCDYERRRSEAA